MPVTVEFYGIARRRAGIERLDVEADTLGEALDRVAEQLPAWADACLCQGELTRTFLASRNGQAFITERTESLSDGDSLLILSTDVGG
jgi:molybdopterin converting factor small subunit